MTNVERSPTSLLSRVGPFLLFGVLAFGLTGCYTQLQLTDPAAPRTPDAEQTPQKQDDRSMTYADEYRREYRRDAPRRTARRETATYQYNYYFDRGEYYSGWGDAPFFHDPWGIPHDPWHYGPWYGSRFSVAFRVGSPYFYARPWWHPRSEYYLGYGLDFYRPYENFYIGDSYYYDGDVQRRDYRPRGATIGRAASSTARRTADRQGSRSAEKGAARTRTGRIGRSRDDARAAQTGRADRSRASTRIGRSSRDADAPRARRTPRRRSERSTRSRSGRQEARERTRDRSTRSRSGNRDRAEQESSRSGDSGSKGRSRSRDGSDDENGRRLRSEADRSSASSTGRIGRRTAPRALSRSIRESIPTRIQTPDFGDRKARLKKKQRRKRRSFQFDTNDFDRLDRATNDPFRRAQRSQPDRRRASNSGSSSSNGRARSSRNNSSSDSDNGGRSRSRSESGNGR
ncbi:MAG: hypothetical protein ABEL51_03865 [Salinibacter sp.]